MASKSTDMKLGFGRMSIYEKLDLRSSLLDEGFVATTTDSNLCNSVC